VGNDLLTVRLDAAELGHKSSVVMGWGFSTGVSEVKRGRPAQLSGAGALSRPVPALRRRRLLEPSLFPAASEGLCSACFRAFPATCPEDSSVSQDDASAVCLAAAGAVRGVRGWSWGGGGRLPAPGPEQAGVCPKLCPRLRSCSG